MASLVHGVKEHNLAHSYHTKLRETPEYPSRTVQALLTHVAGLDSSGISQELLR
jgi:hypothetical protein